LVLGFSISPRIYTHLAAVENNLDDDNTEEDYACDMFKRATLLFIEQCSNLFLLSNLDK